MSRSTRYTKSSLKSSINETTIIPYQSPCKLNCEYGKKEGTCQCNKSLPKKIKSRRDLIKNTPNSIPVNTRPIIETIEEPIKKDCGWFGEKCILEESGKGLDLFVKEEQKKQDASWKWFNDGVRETQDNIANFFENEGIKQKETIQVIQESIDDTGKEVTTFFENEGIKQDIAWEKFDTDIKNIQSNADQLGSDVIKNITDIGKGAEEFLVDVSKGAEDLGKGLGDFNRNIMIIGAVGLGAVVLMGMRT